MLVVVVVVVECIFVMLITVSLRPQSHSSAPHCGHPDHGDTNTRGDTVLVSYGQYCIDPAVGLMNNSKTGYKKERIG